VALDLETTGLFAETDRIVEVGAVRFDGSGRELGRFEQLINPGRPMSPGAWAIHGISDADLVDAPPACAVLLQFLAFLGDPESVTLLAHNARFDAGFLGWEPARCGLPAPSWEIVDTLTLARRQWPDASNHQLDTLAELLRLDPHAPHRALGDGLRVKGLWLALGAGAEPPEPWSAYPIHDALGSVPVPAGWEPLAEAMLRSLGVRIEYHGGSRGAAPREITPRRFAQRGGTTYIVAHCHIDNFEKSFRLDRVIRFEVVSEASRKSASGIGDP
jgi:DNA polymerase-3 subunit epsilon